MTRLTYRCTFHTSYVGSKVGEFGCLIHFLLVGESIWLIHLYLYPAMWNNKSAFNYLFLPPKEREM